MIDASIPTETVFMGTLRASRNRVVGRWGGTDTEVSQEKSPPQKGAPGEAYYVTNHSITLQ